MDVKLLFIAYNCNVPLSPGEEYTRTIRIVINLLSFLMAMYCMRQQEIQLIQWVVQNSLVPVYLTGSVCFDNAPKIKFYLYVLFSTCFIHGLVGEGRLIYNICGIEKKW